MTADASRSCLGLATCVGSAIRQIVDARVTFVAFSHNSAIYADDVARVIASRTMTASGAHLPPLLRWANGWDCPHSGPNPARLYGIGMSRWGLSIGHRQERLQVTKPQAACETERPGLIMGRPINPGI